MKFPALTATNARALAYHARQGEPFCGITPDALAKWLDSIAEIVLEVEPEKRLGTGDSLVIPTVKIS